MSASKLSRPEIRFKESFLEALPEYHAEGNYEHLSRELLESDDDFGAFVEGLRADKGYPHQPYQDWVEPVPETVLWLVKDDAYIGTSKIRHRINWHLEKWGGHIHWTIRPSMRNKGFGKKILMKSIPYASHFGIERALLTIEPDNDAAAKIIEFCGGEFWDQTPDTQCFPSRKRFWLNCE